MDLILLGLMTMAALDGGSKSKKDKKSYKRKAKKDNSWLDAAWFYDHNQKL